MTKNRKRAELVMPMASLSGCIFSYIIRDTRGVVLSDSERMNRFPASPLCAITWVMEGQTLLVPSQYALLAISFSGPQSEPILSYNPSSVYAVTVGIYPEALHLLSGIDISKFQDKTVPLETVFDGELLEVFQDAFRGGFSPETKLAFESELVNLWRDKRREEPKMPQMLQDWVRSLVIRAATSGTGKGLRQTQRRLKNMTGQNQRDLSTYVRMENLFSAWTKDRGDGKSTMAGIASDVGFSDQSHMGRDVKRIIGTSPSAINKLIDTDESFWFYRLMGERY